ncbi:MAG: hypothetical protein ABL907_02530 [Hyphomicrobium sp.]
MNGYRLRLAGAFLVYLSGLQPTLAASIADYGSAERSRGTPSRAAEHTRIAQFIWQQQQIREKARQDQAHKAQVEAQKQEAARKAQIEEQRKAQDAARRAQAEAQRKAMILSKAKSGSNGPNAVGSNEKFKDFIDLQQQVQDQRKKREEDEEERMKR